MHGINSLFFFPPLWLSAATSRLSHELTLSSCFFLSGLAEEPIQSCLKVKKLKSPEPPVSLAVWWQEQMKKGEEKQNKTYSTGGNGLACKRRLIFLATSASTHHGALCLFWTEQADSLIQNIQQYRMEGKVTRVLSSLVLQMNLWSGWHVDIHFENKHGIIYQLFSPESLYIYSLIHECLGGVTQTKENCSFALRLKARCFCSGCSSI